MVSEVLKRMDALKATSAKRVLMEYYRERLLDHQSKLAQYSDETFKIAKGRCLELEDLIRYLES